MAIDLCKTNRKSGEPTFTPVCAANTFVTYWLPPAKELGLQMIECLPALVIRQEFKDQFIEEISQLRNWIDLHAPVGIRESILESIDRVMDIVSSTSLDEYELSTG
ncbi:hypothetical protein Plim_3580 [Planctopirus limnophila DSM 3776]|uniref:Uncharacterized protein n=1 Tax=Planctopirus limnophila (strain ATCC 43296 / DSM 3776 / IFAM 1008 / Mu 290) TaxID=521674 RepID=D5SVN3_PLAL2|nr:hypothetical protein [Planctopirus limnophila]ADG69393.1 hypothetical protein Plim_3580 [Planctopirus limnophila DSM 3776]